MSDEPTKEQIAFVAQKWRIPKEEAKRMLKRRMIE